MADANAFLIYQDDNGVSNVNVRFEGEDVWLAAERLQQLFQASRQDVAYHIQQIYSDGELMKEATCKNFLQVRQEGKRSVKRSFPHYNLDMILAIGMRIRSDVAVRFRQWAIRHLHEFAVKGFTLDDDRLKGSRSRYFRELLQRIRDIRMSERNFYQKVTDIFATSVDYDRTNDITRTFFATVQNKLHFAALRCPWGRLRPPSRTALACHRQQPKSSAEARFTDPTENCYTSDHDQESPCQPMLRNECCDEKLLAGFKKGWLVMKNIINSIVVLCGVICLDGNANTFSQTGYPVNKIEDVRWLRKGAEQGNAEAQYAYANCLLEGKGISPNATEAARWFRKAAEQGNADALYALGLCYSTGHGVVQDLHEAVDLYRKAAGQGHAISQSMLGNCYLKGKGVPPNLNEALRWYRKAAEQGDAGAQFYIGGFYCAGIGVQENMLEGMRWLRKAAEQGHAQAQYGLSECYASGGEGVPQDQAEAVKWCRMSAVQGYAEAQRVLGHCYYCGKGVSQDKAESMRWFCKAAEQGDVKAQVILAAAYLKGIGVPKSKDQGVRWYRKAAEQGDADAQRALDSMYKNGRGVEKKGDVESMMNVAEKTSQRPAAGEMLKLVATVDGKEVRLARVKIGDKQELTPVFRTGLRKGDAVGPFHVTYEKDGKKYAQDFKSIFVDWEGAKTFTFPLKIVDSSTKPESGAGLGSSRKGAVQRSDLDELLRDLENKR